MQVGDGRTGDLNGRNTGVTSGQEGVSGSEMTEELMYAKGREEIVNVAPESGRHLTFCLASP